MKKILLIILTIILILSVNVLAVDIDIGVTAEDYTASWCHGTLINKSNPANASGQITTVQIFSKVNMINVTVAIFYRPDPTGFPNNLSTREGGNVYLSDLLVPGYHSFVGVTLNVMEGDFIGVEYTNGDIEKKVGGEQGLWYINYADHVPCDNQTFNFQANNAIAIYGTGATAVGWDHKWNTKTISKWNTKEFTKWNGLE